MSTTSLPHRRQPPAPPAARRGRRWPWVATLAAGGLLLVLAPVLLLGGSVQPPCGAGVGARSAPTGHLFAAPLHLLPGRWYRIGATEYGGPGDPRSSTLGASGAYLPALPDSFAELSLLTTNPANGGSLTFADADALDNLPYGTAIRVHTGSAQRVLVKRDIGYGQGPGQAIPYRIDVWWQAAHALGITKNPVQIALAPASGTAGVLSALPTSTPSPAASTPTVTCPGQIGPLPVTTGAAAQILPSGYAAAPADAPRPVKLAIAAGNQIIDKPYPIPVAHFGPLAQLWPAYDCSGTVSYVLYKLGLLGVAEDSTQLQSFGAPGPGKWITVYANPSHTWIVIAGVALDTSATGNPGTWTPAGSGPRWRPNPTGNLADGWSYVVRHPAEL